MLSLSHFLILGAILFAISIIGIFLNRKNVIILLMAIELMLLAVNLNFIAFSHYLGDIAFSADGRTICATSPVGSLAALWDARSGAYLGMSEAAESLATPPWWRTPQGPLLAGLYAAQGLPYGFFSLALPVLLRALPLYPQDIAPQSPSRG